MAAPTENSFDTIILGQGLAGSLLAWELVERGQRILVLDDASPNAASRIAAGLVNPVTGPRLVLTPDANQLLGTMRRTIGSIETRFGTRLFHPLPLMRRFESDRMLDLWRRRIADPAYTDYLDPQPQLPSTLGPIKAPLGGFHQLQTGWLDSGGLVRLLGNWLETRGSLSRGRTSHDTIRIGANGVRVGTDLRARTLVFCEGYRLTDNPWFDWLPLQPAKGEILTLQTRHPLPRQISSAGRWLVPLEKDRFRFGATYSWQQIDEEPSNDGKTTLLKELAELFPSFADAEVCDHRAGVRPGTRDRYPLIGLHPSHGELAVFNGFGSKGSLMIPWYARRFADFLLGNDPLPARADIARYSSNSIL